VRDDYQMQGWMFINFIALMLHYCIYNLLRKKGMLRHYSPRDVIEHLERICRLKIGKNGNSRRYQRNRGR